MNRYGPFIAWMDARHNASTKSIRFGHSWVVSKEDGYWVVASVTVESAPQEFVAEYKGGIEQ